MDCREKQEKKKRERELGKHTEESPGILDVGFLCLLRGAVVSDVEEFGPMGVDKMISEMKTIGWASLVRGMQVTWNYHAVF